MAISPRNQRSIFCYKFHPPNLSAPLYQTRNFKGPLNESNRSIRSGRSFAGSMLFRGLSFYGLKFRSFHRLGRSPYRVPYGSFTLSLSLLLILDFHTERDEMPLKFVRTWWIEADETHAVTRYERTGARSDFFDEGTNHGRSFRGPRGETSSPSSKYPADLSFLLSSARFSL